MLTEDSQYYFGIRSHHRKYSNVSLALVSYSR